MNVFRNGECERLKAGVHGTIAILAALCCGYSVGAMIIRRRVHAHLLVNAILYGALVAIEHQHVLRHLEHGTHDQTDLLPTRRL